VGHSDTYLAWGNLLRTIRPETHLEIARDHYEQALALDQFNDTAQQAAAHYQLGELVLWHDDDPAGAISHYQAALELAPADHWARLRLGYALYWSSGDVALAEQEILSAIDHWPGTAHLKWPYFYLGEIYEHAGRTAQAIAAYESLLTLDPTDERVQERLDALRSQ
jgi:tetratricopeptide (TPR) repeat protein